MSEGQERETGEGGLEDAGDEGLRSWVGGPSVLRKGRFDVTINRVCKGGMKAVGGFFRIITPGVSVRDVGNLEGYCICCGATVLDMNALDVQLNYFNKA